MNKETTRFAPTLSIRISADGFCFCTYHPRLADSVKYFFYECDKRLSLCANFDAAWEEYGFDGGTYAAIQVIVATTEFTPVPPEYDKKEDYKALYNSCFPASDGSVKILSNRLTAYNHTILFSIDGELYNRLCEIGEVSYYSPVSILLGFLSRYQREERRYILAFLHGDKSLFMAMDDGRPVLMNGFDAENTGDQLYYMLCIWNELGMSQTQDTLLLCGDAFADAFEMSAKNFIRDIKRINPRELFRPNLLNKIETIPFDLQALLLCE